VVDQQKRASAFLVFLQFGHPRFLGSDLAPVKKRGAGAGASKAIG
jgi:hypothetical protein